jgi:shikimate dehydrogenase
MTPPLPYAEVIGDPIAHSKSPLIHGFWLQALGIQTEYRATRVTPEGLAGYFGARRADPAWRGTATSPSRTSRRRSTMSRIAATSRSSIGAINTVVRAGDGALIGTNTDAGGFYAPIAGLDLEGRHAVVIGAGGGARAILFALSKVGIGRVTILNRNVLKAAALLSSFGIKGDALPLGSPLPPADLLVNASAGHGRPAAARSRSRAAAGGRSGLRHRLYAARDAVARSGAGALARYRGRARHADRPGRLRVRIVLRAEPPRERDDELRDCWRHDHDRPHRVDRHGQVDRRAMFADQGVPVFDADATVHQLQGPGGALVEAIEAAFPDTTGAQGVDRTAAPRSRAR